MGDMTLAARVMELEQMVAVLETAFKSHCANHLVVPPVVRKPVIRKKVVKPRAKRGESC